MGTVDSTTAHVNLSKWVDALRSGEYVQCKHRFRDRSGRFCAIGVGAELLGDWPVRTIAGLGESCGLRFEDLEAIVDLNDTGYTFDEIADYIEKEFM